MSIHELLAMIPAERLQVQFFHEGDLEAQHTKKGTRVTFYTGALTVANMLENTAPEGVVIWISREDWKRVCDETKGMKELAE